MLMSIFNGLYVWLSQLQRLLWLRFNNLSPAEYTMMLVFCVCAGLFLLRGKR